MIIDIIEYQLKDGRTARIRSPKDEDIQEMLDFLYVSAGETDFLMRCPEECGRYTPESEKQRFDRVNKADNETMLLCFVEGKLAGSGQTMWSKNQASGQYSCYRAASILESGNCSKADAGTDKNCREKSGYSADRTGICRGEYPGQSLI